MKKLLQAAAIKVGERSKRRILTDSEYKTLQSRYLNILTRAVNELPPFPEKTGLRGRIKHTVALEHLNTLSTFVKSRAT
ncbi:MAG: hypothetical protein HQK52_13485 [Oligoflexia bacterium]|nr:hypothetical protein [Oligoflexia bacterium]